MTHTFALVSKCVANCGQSTFDRRGYGANWPERCDSPPLGPENDGGHGVECVLRRSEAGNVEIRSRARKASIVRREKISSAGEGLVQGTIAVITQCGADQPERDRPLSVSQDSRTRGTGKVSVPGADKKSLILGATRGNISNRSCRPSRHGRSPEPCLAREDATYPSIFFGGGLGPVRHTMTCSTPPSSAGGATDMRWKHWTVLFISACLNNFAEKKMAWLSCERWIWPSGAGKRGAGGRANRGSTGWPRSRFMAHHCLTNMGWLAAGAPFGKGL